MGDANQNDIVAALKVWMETLSRDRRIVADTVPRIIQGFDELVGMIRQEQVDVISVPTDEYLRIEDQLAKRRRFVLSLGGEVTEEYLVLVRQDSTVNCLNDLRGKRLSFLDHPRTVLAQPWLEVELLRRGLPMTDRFFREVEHVTKPNKAILPVFFGQSDGCVVTRRSFDLAGELNPQVKLRLRAIATSPALLPSVGSYRAKLAPSAVDPYLTEVVRLKETTSGKHLLNMFQCDAIVEITEAELTATRSLLEEWVRLKSLLAVKK